MAAFIGGPGMALPALGAIGGGGGGGAPRTFAQLASDLPWKIRFKFDRQQVLQTIAFEALDNIARGNLNAGTMNDARKVFKAIAGSMKRDGDAKTLQQCETEFVTHKAAFDALRSQRSSYRNEKSSLKEKLPTPGSGDPFEKSDTLKGLEEQIEDSRKNMTNLGWTVIQSMCFGVADVSYSSLPKMNQQFNRMLDVYYKINGTPAVGLVGAKPGLLDKLTEVETSIDEAHIRAEKREADIRTRVKKFLIDPQELKTNGVSLAIALGGPTVADWFSGGTTADTASWIAVRVAIFALARAGAWVMSAPD